MSSGSRQLVRFRNVRISQQRPQSLPPLTNTNTQTKVHSYESISDLQYTRYDRLRSLSYHDEYSTKGINKRHPYSFVYSQRDTINDNQLYAEIGNDSASGTINRTRRPYLSTWRPTDDDMADNASGSYATIEEPQSNAKTHSKRRHLFRRH